MKNINDTNQHLNSEHKKTNSMKLFSKDNPLRPVFVACVLFLIAAYFLYFAALLFPTPEWGRELMTWAMPMVRNLDSAARVSAMKGTDPFPAQLVILYCVLGSIALMVWCLFWFYHSREACNSSLLQLFNLQRNSWRSRVRALYMGISGAFIPVLVLYGIFWFSSASITWRDRQFYSPSIGSVSFLIIATMIFSFMVATAFLPFIYIQSSKDENLSKKIN